MGCRAVCPSCGTALGPAPDSAAMSAGSPFQVCPEEVAALKREVARLQQELADARAEAAALRRQQHAPAMPGGGGPQAESQGLAPAPLQASPAPAPALAEPTLSAATDASALLAENAVGSDSRRVGAQEGDTQNGGEGRSNARTSAATAAAHQGGGPPSEQSVAVLPDASLEAQSALRCEGAHEGGPRAGQCASTSQAATLVSNGLVQSDGVGVEPPPVEASDAKRASMRRGGRGKKKAKISSTTECAGRGEKAASPPCDAVLAPDKPNPVADKQQQLDECWPRLREDIARMHLAAAANVHQFALGIVGVKISDEDLREELRRANLTPGGTASSTNLSAAAVSSMQKMAATPREGSCAGAADLLQAVVNNDVARTIFTIGRLPMDERRQLLDTFNTSGDSCVSLAAKSGCMQVLAVLIEHKADADILSLAGTTPLHEAVWEGRVESARLLLAHGANPKRYCTAERTRGDNALHLACRRNKSACVQLLLEHDRSLAHACTERGEPPLYYAALHEVYDAMEVLHRVGGADVDAGNRSGVTALHNAVLNGNEETVRRLLAMRCSVDAQTNTGETPLFVACSTGNLGMIDLLLAAGKLPEMLNVPDHKGRRPFHMAHMQGHFDAAAYLLSKGARASCVDSCAKCRMWGKMARRRLDRQMALRDKERQQRLLEAEREEERRLVEQEEHISFEDFVAEMRRVEQGSS